MTDDLLRRSAAAHAGLLGAHRVVGPGLDATVLGSEASGAEAAVRLAIRRAWGSRVEGWPLPGVGTLVVACEGRRFEVGRQDVGLRCARGESMSDDELRAWAATQGEAGQAVLRVMRERNEAGAEARKLGQSAVNLAGDAAEIQASLDAARLEQVELRRRVKALESKMRANGVEPWPE